MPNEINEQRFDELESDLESLYKDRDFWKAKAKKLERELDDCLSYMQTEDL